MIDLANELVPGAPWRVELPALGPFSMRARWKCLKKKRFRPFSSQVLNYMSYISGTRGVSGFFKIFLFQLDKTF